MFQNKNKRKSDGMSKLYKKMHKNDGEQKTKEDKMK